MHTSSPSRQKKKKTSPQQTPQKKRKLDSTLTDSDKTEKRDTDTQHQVTVTVDEGSKKIKKIESIISSSLPSSQMPDLSQIRTRRDLRTDFGSAHVAERSGASLDSDSLLMRTGSVADLLPKHDSQWSDIAQNLNKVFAKYIKDALKSGERRPDYAELCTVYYATGEQRQIKGLRDAQRLNDQSPGQLEAIADFLDAFMLTNGQWDYIRNQDWAKDGNWAIGIDVNYYPDRSEFTGYPAFHKDSGGNNIFVNLIFDNKNTIEATEWFPDPAQPSKERREWQEKLLPKSHLAALDLASEALRARFRDSDNVSGGESSPRHTYLSWVDDLVWHSTPSPTLRYTYSAKAAKAAYPKLSGALSRDSLSFDDLTIGAPVPVLEVLGSIADSPETELYKWLDNQGLGPQDITLGTAKAAWGALYKGSAGRQRFNADVATRGKLEHWKLTGVNSEASAADNRLQGSKSIKETPVGLSKRRRANSLNEAAIRELREANEKTPRSFIRTWVRILSKEGAQQEKELQVV